jgi:hypothetical protein
VDGGVEREVAGLMGGMGMGGVVTRGWADAGEGDKWVYQITPAPNVPARVGTHAGWECTALLNGLMLSFSLRLSCGNVYY